MSLVSQKIGLWIQDPHIYYFACNFFHRYLERLKGIEFKDDTDSYHSEVERAKMNNNDYHNWPRNKEHLWE